MIYVVIAIAAFIAGYCLHDILHRKEVEALKSLLEMQQASYRWVSAELAKLNNAYKSLGQGE